MSYVILAFSPIVAAISLHATQSTYWMTRSVAEPKPAVISEIFPFSLLYMAEMLYTEDIITR